MIARVHALAVLLAVLLFSVRADALPVPQHVIDRGLASDPIIRAGYLPVTFYDADPTGVKDSTDAIQKAIDDGREFGLVTYLPPGTYLISRTLVGVQHYQMWGCADHFGKPSPGRAYADYGTGMVMRKAPSLVGPTSGPRPILKLKDNASGFGDPNDPRAAIHFYGNGPGYGFEKPWMGQFDCGMNFHLRNLEVHLGSGNPGAIGVQIPTAQYSALHDVKVVATGAYAGFRGTTHTKTSVNLEVEGGRYGVIFALGSENLVGVTLRNQETAAVLVSCYSPVSITGFRIEQKSGAAIVVDTSVFGFTNQGSQVTLLDGVIDLAQPNGAAIQNDVAGEGSSFYARNVYVRTPGDLVQSGSAKVARAAGTFSQVIEYAFTDPRRNGGVGAVSVVDGARAQAPVVNVAPTESAPSDLVSRHTRVPLPWFMDPGVKNVMDPDVGAKGDGKTDDTSAIQSAIDKHGKVFLPRGDYQVKGTLTLRKDTQLFGVPGGKSRIYAESWTPAVAAYVLSTDDDRAATTLLSDVWVNLPGGYEKSKLGALDWRAGRHSVVNELYYDMSWEQDRTSHPRSMVRVSGAGGGRWYNTMLGQTYDARTQHADMRLLLIDGTSEPLTFYSMNAEYSNSPTSEIRNASNVRIIGNKTEVAHVYLVMKNAKNVLHVGMGGHCQVGFGVPCGPTFTAIEIHDSSQFVLANETFYPGSHDLGALIQESPGDVIVAGTDNATLYKRGAFDDSAFPFCGDAVCDPHAESSASCPADCGAEGGAGGRLDGGTAAGAGAPGAGGGASGSAATEPGADGAGCACTTVPRTANGFRVALGLAIAVLAVRRGRRPRALP